jgi:hypothetical protein
VNGLLRVHASAAGIRDSEIETDIRTNRPDGGVDTLLRQADPADPTGWIRVPTAWQYKATARNNVGSPGDLLSGEYVRERIREGFAYRPTVADSLSSPERATLTVSLGSKCQEIRAHAAEPMVVTADHLAGWANRYPGFVLRWFLPHLQALLLHLEAWRICKRNLSD